jgi:hypothetical protein
MAIKRRSEVLNGENMHFLEACTSAELWKLLCVPALSEIVLEAALYSGLVAQKIDQALKDQFADMAPASFERLTDFVASVARAQKTSLAVLG